MYKLYYIYDNIYYVNLGAIYRSYTDRTYDDAVSHCKSLNKSLITQNLRETYNSYIYYEDFHRIWIDSTTPGLCPYSYVYRYNYQTYYYTENSYCSSYSKYWTVCIAQATWNEWSAWGECTVSCGTIGTKTRTRTCPTGATIGQPGCIGPTVNSTDCTVSADRIKKCKFLYFLSFFNVLF